MNTEYAKKYFEKKGWLKEDTDEMQKRIVNNILDITKAIDSIVEGQGHSGFSYAYLKGMLIGILNQELGKEEK